MIRQDIIDLYSYLEAIGVSSSMLQDKDLLGRISQNKPLFEIDVVDNFEMNTVLEVRLHFRTCGTESYFLLKYDACLHYFDQPDRKVGQTFLMLQMVPTLKEAFNLLQGRSVVKTIRSTKGENHKCWVKLDFSERDSSDNYKLIRYRYDPSCLEKLLDQYPTMIEAEDQNGRSKLLDSLKAGNKELVTIRKHNGRSMKRLVEMNPEAKTLKISGHPKRLAK